MYKIVFPFPMESTYDESKSIFESFPNVKSDLNVVTIGLRRRQIYGSQQCAKATLEILRSLIRRNSFASTYQLLKIVRYVGTQLISAATSELTIGNIVRRVLYIIREEHWLHLKESAKFIKENQLKQSTSSKKSTTSNKPVDSKRERTNSNSSGDTPISSSGLEANSLIPSSMSTMEMYTTLDSLQDSDYLKYFPDLKGAVLGVLDELHNEIDNVGAICERVFDYIHVDECILTYGYSKTVESFLEAAGVKRRFQCIIMEAAPGLEGHKLAVSLSKFPNISVTLMPDSNIYAIMSKVNKVIFAPEAIIANGGAVCSSGHTMVCVTAKEFSVPVVGVAGTYTLSPLYSHHQISALNHLLSPSTAIPYNADINFDNVEVSYPAYDYVPPEMIDLFVTNEGSQLPSYIFRLMSEYYHPNDYTL